MSVEFKGCEQELGSGRKAAQATRPSHGFLTGEGGLTEEERRL